LVDVVGFLLEEAVAAHKLAIVIMDKIHGASA